MEKFPTGEWSQYRGVPLTVFLEVECKDIIFPKPMDAIDPWCDNLVKQKRSMI